MKHIQLNKTRKIAKAPAKAVLLASLLFVGVNAYATEVESDFYGSLRLGADYVDSGTADDAVNGRDYLSRIGVNAKVQLTDGLIGLGKVEYGLRGDDVGQSH
ncbi:MAG: hypothetical protein GY928_31340 [Colwellia sp.]|nr:hypothetical protein [Colwellia sp.]